MTTPTLVAAPALTTVPRVELIEVGRWNISNIEGWEPQPEDLANAVAALECPAVRRPVLKFGHVEGAGDPAIGYIANMATAEEGHLLVGDYAGVPAWLASEDQQGNSVLASAYPDRSCEGEYDYVCQLGHTHPFVLHAMALLGVVRPGVGTLQSLHDLYANAPAQESLVTASTRVAASATTDDVRRQYYAGPGADWDLWIEQMYVEPPELIVHNDSDGSLTRVSFAVAPDGAVTFDDPQTVKVQYVAARAAATKPVVAWATQGEARGQRPTSTEGVPSSAPAAAGSTTTEEARSMDLLTSLRQSLGLPEDADEATVLSAHTAALADLERLNEAAGATPTPAPLPEGVVTIDSATLQELQVAASAGRAAREQQLTEQRTRAVDAAIGDGRIPPVRRDAWLAQLAADPGAETVLASMAPGLVPVAAKGYDTPTEVGDDSTAAEGALNAQFPGLLLTPRSA